MGDKLKLAVLLWVLATVSKIKLRAIIINHVDMLTNLFTPLPARALTECSIPLSLGSGI